MNIEQRIKAFASLGAYFENLSEDEFQTLTLAAKNQNPWFTAEYVGIAIDGVSQFLKPDLLIEWVQRYTLPSSEKKVAIVMAGNIPFVGFHDFLCVLIAGHTAMIKLSSKDRFLMELTMNKLIEIDPAFAGKIIIVERLKNFDAVIATGSDNTSRYFEYYFAKYPHIIRKNRTSVAILNGNETDAELAALGDDIFTYFGLGCRNVSKIFIPKNFSFDRLFKSWSRFEKNIHHHKYCNNYDYQKSILLINRQHFLDNGFIMLQESEKFVSPISVLYYEFYEDENQLAEKLNVAKDKIQVIAGHSSLSDVPFGQCQLPRLTDYADKVDTLAFLSNVGR